MWWILLLSVLCLGLVQHVDSTACGASVGTGCHGSYCPGSYYTGSTCINGYCRCPHNSQRDYCTCLAISGECRIERNSALAVGSPTFEGQSQTSYSCVADENCNYDVHVVSNYEGDYNHGFGPVTRAGRTNVWLRVSGEGSKPLVLVFVSYEPVNWILSIPQGVIIEKVLLGSYYLSNSDVTYSSGSVRSVERHNSQTLPSGYGSDTGGGETDTILAYVVSRFGPVASFSGSYRADSWTLNIHRGNTTGQDHSRSCSVIPGTNSYPSDPSSNSGTNSYPSDPSSNSGINSYPSDPSSNSGTSSYPFDSSSNSSPGTQATQPIPSIVVSTVIVLVLGVIAVTIIVIVVMIRRANRFRHNQRAASHLPPNQVFYAQQSANFHYTHARTSPAEHNIHTQDWTSKSEGTSQQVLLDSAPPAYHVALKFPQPPSKSDDPPPYPG